MQYLERKLALFGKSLLSLSLNPGLNSAPLEVMLALGEFLSSFLQSSAWIPGEYFVFLLVFLGIENIAG